MIRRGHHSTQSRRALHAHRARRRDRRRAPVHCGHPYSYAHSYRAPVPGYSRWYRVLCQIVHRG